MGRVFNNPATGKITVEGDGGGVVWTTDGRPVNLLPDSASIVLNNYSIEFPSFETFVNYGYRTIFQQGDTCQTVVMIRPEERTLPNIVLGSLPAGANYIDVRVQLSRTVSPSTYLDDPVPALIPNAQVFLPGGSCIVEATPIWRRLFEIVISGSQIILRRRQSVTEIPVAFPNSEGWRRYAGIYRNNNGDRQEGSSNTWSGWGNNASTGHQAGHPAALIQSKPFGYNPGHSAPSNQAKARGRGNACSMSHNHNYASTFTGQIVIRPGYIAA